MTVWNSGTGGSGSGASAVRTQVKTWTVESPFTPGVTAEVSLPGLGRCIPLFVHVSSTNGLSSGDVGTNAVSATIGTVAVPVGVSSIPEALGAAGDRLAASQGPFGICSTVVDISDLKIVLTAAGDTPDCGVVTGDLVVSLYYVPIP